MTSTNIVDDITRGLMSETPDVARLLNAVTDSLAVPPDDATRVLRRVTSLANAEMFPPITHLELILTEGCNLACTYCFEKEMLGYRRMPLNVATAAVDLLFEYSRDAQTLQITHFGGEPTLNFDAIRAVTEHAEQRAAETGKTVEFDTTTNGTLLTAVMVEYFARHKIMALLSVDGMPETNNLFRIDKRGMGTFDRVLAGMKLLKATQKWVGVKMTVMPANAGRLLDDVKGLFDLGVNQFVIGHATGIDWPSAAMDIYGQQLRLVHKWYLVNKGDELRIAEFEDSGSTPAAFFGCQAGRDTIAVTVDGEISSCSKILALDKKNLIAKLGDIQHGLTHLRNRAELVNCSTLKSACHEKGISADYQGGCFASNYSASGDLFNPNLQDHHFAVLNRSLCAGCGSSR